MKYKNLSQDQMSEDGEQAYVRRALLAYHPPIH